MGGGEDAGAGVTLSQRRWRCRLAHWLTPWLALTAFGSEAPPPLQAAVAANFREAFGAVAEAAASHGQPVAGTFGASGLLYAQIANGRPFDVFLSADAARPEALLAADLAYAPVRYARGQLALLVNGGIAGPEWLGADKRVALANRILAPYGRAAAETLAALDATVQRIIATNVAQAYQFADSGAVDGAFVALAQVQAQNVPAPRYWIVPSAHHAPIDQVAVGIRGGDEARTRAFLRLLATPETQALIRAHGYR